jgi:hypothetical protein
MSPLSGLGVALDCHDHPPANLTLKSVRVVF